VRAWIVDRFTASPAAWIQDLVTVEVSSGGRAAVAQSMAAADAGEVLHSLADEPDVMELRRNSGGG
jgi:hypothetical protein